MSIPKSEITQLLRQLDSEDELRDSEIYGQLFDLVYDQLKNIAHTRLEKEYAEHEYSKTALVHEVYLKMINQDKIEASDRSHFYALASRCMRQILIDYARKMKAQKRGGKQHKITYIDKLLINQKKAEEILHVDKKLKKLATLNGRLSKIVELRFFGGMTIEDTAEVLDVSMSTVKRDWKKARGWLYKELK
ncbi:MAG: ECF-type sigma factor [Bacteroidota bacterium]